MNLGQPNMILVALAGLAYLAQGYISMIGIPEEQKKTMKSMLIVSPLMIVFMSFSSPAGVALYWVVGGIFTCIQSAITNILLRPRIKKQVQEELKNNPPKQVVTPIKDVTPKDTNKKRIASKRRSFFYFNSFPVISSIVRIDFGPKPCNESNAFRPRA